MTTREIGGRVRAEAIEEGALWRVVLTGSKGNIIDTALCVALAEVYRDAALARGLKGVLLEGDGPSFSYGASIAEHLPEAVGAMLHAFHGLFATMLESAVVTLGVVRGRCLGGGLELASFCHRVFASPDATFGQPEIVLGVFAPLASMFLRERTGRGPAEDLCLSGRTLAAREALHVGLVDVVADDPFQAALAYAREHFLPRSAASLRHAVRAVRGDLRARFASDIAALERLYLEELMRTSDAEEGIRAFLEKRAPRWRNA
jgi:cyclohexa-1,5-dienecarbonyl-CoA hydratase